MLCRSRIRRISGSLHASTTFETLKKKLCSNVNHHVRNAHAAELFRQSYYMSKKGGQTSITVEDLDQLVISENSRPSVLLPLVEISGKALALATHFVPPFCKDILDYAVDEATIQQFNDSIRDMQQDGVDNVDVKETLKFHRDVRNSDDVSSGSTSNTGQTKSVVTTCLYHALKVTHTL